MRSSGLVFFVIGTIALMAGIVGLAFPAQGNGATTPQPINAAAPDPATQTALGNLSAYTRPEQFLQEGGPALAADLLRRVDAFTTTLATTFPKPEDQLALGDQAKAIRVNLLILQSTTGEDAKKKAAAELVTQFTTIQQAIRAAKGGAAPSNVPYLNQADYPGITAGGETLQSSACGIVSLAMVLQSYGKTDAQPPALAIEAAAKGWYGAGVSGTSEPAYEYFAQKYGLRHSVIFNHGGGNVGKVTDAEWQSLVSTLQQKKPVIISGTLVRGGGDSMKPFSAGGHYVVALSISDDLETIYVNNPGKRAYGINYPVSAAGVKQEITRAILIQP